MDQNESLLLGQVDGKLDRVIKALEELSTRLTYVEKFVYRCKGVIAFLVIAATIAWATGCATTKTTCKVIFEDGSSYEGTARTTVVGQGMTDVEIAGNLCGDVNSSTQDTGLSEGFVSSITNITDAAKAATAAGAAASVGGLLLNGLPNAEDEVDQ